MNESKPSFPTSTTPPTNPVQATEILAPKWEGIVPPEKSCCWRKEAILQMTMKLLEITNSKTTFDAEASKTATGQGAPVNVFVGPVYDWIDPKDVIGSYVARAGKFIDQIEAQEKK